MRITEGGLRRIIREVLNDDVEAHENIFHDFSDVYYIEMKRNWKGFVPNHYFNGEVNPGDPGSIFNQYETEIMGREDLFEEFENSRKSGADDYNLELFNTACELLDWSDDSLATLMMEYAHFLYKTSKRSQTNRGL